MEYDDRQRVIALETRVLQLQREIGVLSAKIAASQGRGQGEQPSILGATIGMLKKILRNGFAWSGYKVDVDHGLVNGLTDDDHAQYLLLAGRAGGQVAIGGTGSGDDLALQTTSHVTKGSYILSELTTAGYVKTDASGVLSSTASLVIPVYSQDDEPDIPNNTIALWVDTDGGPDYYLLADIGGTQYKVVIA